MGEKPPSVGCEEAWRPGDGARKRERERESVGGVCVRRGHRGRAEASSFKNMGNCFCAESTSVEAEKGKDQGKSSGKGMKTSMGSARNNVDATHGQIDPSTEASSFMSVGAGVVIASS